MKLPNADAAFIDSTKLRDYLLAMGHPVGRFKAAFFARLGYAQETWRRLEADLLVFARSNEASPDGVNRYGRKFRVRGILKGPSGQSAEIVAVWIILNDEDFPRFVTAFPGGAQ